MVSVVIDAGAPDPVPGVSQGPRRVIHTYDARPLQRLDLKDPGQAARIWDLQSDTCAPGFAAYYLDAFWLQRPHQAPPDLHTLSNHDFFIAGDSGAGYLNVRALTVRPDSRLRSGLAAWQAHCRRWYERWDLTITGFVLDGAAGAATDLEFAAYRPFSPDGPGTHFESEPALRAGLPTCPEKDLPDSVEDAAGFIAHQAKASAGRTGFLWARSILKSPQWYADLSRRRREEHAGLAIEVVDPYTFFGLVRLQLTAPRN